MPSSVDGAGRRSDERSGLRPGLLGGDVCADGGSSGVELRGVEREGLLAGPALDESSASGPAAPPSPAWELSSGAVRFAETAWRRSCAASRARRTSLKCGWSGLGGPRESAGPSSFSFGGLALPLLLPDLALPGLCDVRLPELRPSAEHAGWVACNNEFIAGHEPCMSLMTD